MICWRNDPQPEDWGVLSGPVFGLRAVLVGCWSIRCVGLFCGPKGSARLAPASRLERKHLTFEIGRPAWTEIVGTGLLIGIAFAAVLTRFIEKSYMEYQATIQSP